MVNEASGGPSIAKKVMKLPKTSIATQAGVSAPCGSVSTPKRTKHVAKAYGVRRSDRIKMTPKKGPIRVDSVDLTSEEGSSTQQSSVIVSSENQSAQLNKDKALNKEHVAKPTTKNVGMVRLEDGSKLPKGQRYTRMVRFISPPQLSKLIWRITIS